MPTEASPAISPPLPATLVTSFSSVPVARTSSLPLRELLVTAPAPSWARVVTAEVAVATSPPMASTPPTATPVALAAWSLVFVASIVTSPSGRVTPVPVVAWTVPLLEAVLTVMFTPTNTPPAPAIAEDWAVGAFVAYG